MGILGSNFAGGMAGGAAAELTVQGIKAVVGNDKSYSINFPIVVKSQRNEFLMEEDLFESEDMNEFFDAMEKAEGRKLYMCCYHGISKRFLRITQNTIF